MQSLPHFQIIQTAKYSAVPIYEYRRSKQQMEKKWFSFDEMDRREKKNFGFLVFAAADSGELKIIAFMIDKKIQLSTQSQLCILWK